MKIVGENIKKIRKQRKLTQLELAERVKVSKIHICLIETGKNEPSLTLLGKIADALNVDPTLLLAKDEAYGIIQSVLALHNLSSIENQVIDMMRKLQLNHTAMK